MDFSSSNLLDAQRVDRARHNASSNLRIGGHVLIPVGSSHVLRDVKHLFVVDGRRTRRGTLHGINGEIVGQIFGFDEGRLGKVVLVLLVATFVDGSENVLMGVFDVSLQRTSIAVGSMAIRYAALVRLLFVMRQHVTVPEKEKSKHIWHGRVSFECHVQMIEPLEAFIALATFMFTILAMRQFMLGQSALVREDLQRERGGWKRR